MRNITIYKRTVRQLKGKKNPLNVRNKQKRLLPFEQWYEEAMENEQKAESLLKQIIVKQEQIMNSFELAKEKYEVVKNKEAEREDAKSLFKD